MQPYLPHYRIAFASSAFLYPLPCRSPLRVSFCLFAEGNGLTVFRA